MKNVVTINWGPGIAAGKDAQEIVDFLKRKGYSLQPKKAIGMVKLTKEIKYEN